MTSTATQPPTGNPDDPYKAVPAVLNPNSDEPRPSFGGEVSALGPRQNMFAHDILAGGPPQDRTGNPADFTGGTLEKGLGGQAEAAEPGNDMGTGGDNRGQIIGL